MSILQSRQSDLPSPDIMSGQQSHQKKPNQGRLAKNAAVERSESVGRDAYYIAKGGVTLNSNALTEMVQASPQPLVVQRKDFNPST